MTPVFDRKPKDESVVTTFRAPRSLYEEVRQISKEFHLTRSETLLRLVRAGIQLHREEEAAGGKPTGGKR